MNKPKTAITPTRAENYSEWYQSVLAAADLAEHSPVRGCMVIKPWGYAIWENIQRHLDKKIKETGHQNAYFPLFIPLSFIEKEAKQVEGFAKECAVVTHHRLETNSDGKLVPAGELEEPLIVRPTSEMIIGHSFAKWVESYRDLPLLINQWANVVRWEMRTRLFLRTAEFLWQEGHTVHATEQEAIEETRKMLDVYIDLCHNYLALPVIPGEKTASERFPGAVTTYTIEGMTQDRKALQAGTSHFLGQTFSRSCGIQFSNIQGEREYGWTTSWAVTTRLIGGLVMTHSDDDGLILPPRIASAHVILIPIVHNEETKGPVFKFCDDLAKRLRALHYEGDPLTVIVDKRDLRGGEKNWSWIKKGAPIRLEVGPREMEAGKVSLARRDKGHKDTLSLTLHELEATLVSILADIQKTLLLRATQFRNKNTVRIETKKEFYDFFATEDKGGFAICSWSEDPEVEKQLKEELGVTPRCIPLDYAPEPGTCPFTGKPSQRKVIFARAY